MVYRGKFNGRVDVPESWIGEEVIVQIIPKKECPECRELTSVEDLEEFNGVCEKCRKKLEGSRSE